MRHATHALWLLYGSLAVGLLGCALMSHQNGNKPGTAFFVAAAVGQAVAVTHSSWLLDEVRHLLARVDHPSKRLTDERNAFVQQEIAEASCCELAWPSLGTAHDPELCTRKDQTT